MIRSFTDRQMTQFETSSLPGVLLITPNVISDERGWFSEFFNMREYEAFGLTTDFKQDNLASSKRGTLRGLHYQAQQTQGKLVRVLLGRIYNVALDVRRSSPTYGEWTAFELSAKNKKAMWIPPGFAHGFLTLGGTAEVMYKTTDYYHPASQRTIFYNDPALGITWPFEEGIEPIVSERDRTAPSLDKADVLP